MIIDEAKSISKETKDILENIEKANNFSEIVNFHKEMNEKTSRIKSLLKEDLINWIHKKTGSDLKFYSINFELNMEHIYKEGHRQPKYYGVITLNSWNGCPNNKGKWMNKIVLEGDEIKKYSTRTDEFMTQSFAEDFREYFKDIFDYVFN